jgi:hypothetical protein
VMLLFEAMPQPTLRIWGRAKSLGRWDGAWKVGAMYLKMRYWGVCHLQYSFIFVSPCRVVRERICHHPVPSYTNKKRMSRLVTVMLCGLNEVSEPYSDHLSIVALLPVCDTYD